MGATAVPTLIANAGVQVAPLLGAGYIEEYLITVAPGSAATDYATGGQPFTMPTKVKGTEFVSIVVLASTPNTRVWKWDGSVASPKLIALSGFATEATAATTVNTDTLTCLLRVRR